MRKWLKKVAGCFFMLFAAASISAVNAPKTMVKAEIQNEVDEVNGDYIEMPWDRDVPEINPTISYSEAREMLVNEPVSLDRGEYNEDIPAAWPCVYSDKESLIDYLEEHITPLRDQGSKGTCWAHSAISLVEQSLLFKSYKGSLENVSRNGNGQIPALDCSELHLAYFYNHGIMNKLVANQEGDEIIFNYTGESFLDVGGNYWLAAEVLSKWRGIVDERIVPYSKAYSFTTDEQKSARTGLPDSLAYKEDQFHLTNAYMLNIHSNVTQVKEAIICNGAVGVTLIVNEDYYNKKYNCYYNYIQNDDIPHAVNIVGWDDDFPAEFFNGTEKPKRNGAWLARNSWSSGAAAEGYSMLDLRGYFWISYEDRTLLNTAYVIEAGLAEEYDNNYYLTNQIYGTGSLSYNKIANVFTLNSESGAEKESIDAVMLQTSHSNVAYSISIYSVDEEGRPFKPIFENYTPTTGTIVFPGIYTIPLTDKVLLDRGTEFAVVVETQNGRICTECYCYGKNITANFTVNEGESFYYSENTWNDLYDLNLADNGNFCIQALTTDIGEQAFKPVDKLKVGERSQGSISISWDGLSDAEDYSVYRAVDLFEEDNLEKIAENITANEYTDDGLDVNSICFYRVVPVINGHEDISRASKILITAVKPMDKDEITASVIATDAILLEGTTLRQKIFGGCGNGASGVVLKYKAVGSSNEWKEIPVRYSYNLGVREWQFYGDDIQPGKYVLSVTPYYENVFGERGYGSSIEKNIQARYSSPGNLSAKYNKSTGYVELSWDAVIGATGYTVIRKLKGATSVKVLGTVTETRLIDKTAKADTSYNYLVYAYNSKISGPCQDYSLYGDVAITIPGKEPEINYGDVNNDGEINAKDVTVLRRYIAGGWNVTIIEANSDINGDGTINAKDVTLLRRFLAGGWEVVLGK